MRFRGGSKRETLEWVLEIFSWHFKSQKWSLDTRCLRQRTQRMLTWSVRGRWSDIHEDTWVYFLQNFHKKVLSARKPYFRKNGRGWSFLIQLAVTPLDLELNLISVSETHFLRFYCHIRFSFEQTSEDEKCVLSTPCARKCKFSLVEQKLVQISILEWKLWLHKKSLPLLTSFKSLTCALASSCDFTFLVARQKAEQPLWVTLQLLSLSLFSSLSSWWLCWIGQTPQQLKYAGEWMVTRLRR